MSEDRAAGARPGGEIGRGIADRAAPGERIGAIVLAAGRSARAGSIDKLRLRVGGEALVVRAVRAATEAGLHPVVVVTGPRGGGVRSELDDRAVEYVDNPDPGRGLASSLRCGLRALHTRTDAVAVVLADMPWIEARHLRHLAAAWWADEAGHVAEVGRPAEPKVDAWVPVSGGRRGNPVVWSARRFADLTGLEGDRGAAQLFARDDVRVVEVPMPDDAVLRDIDTLADWRAALSHGGFDSSESA